MSLPNISEPGKLGGWSSPSTFFVFLSDCREQRGVGSGFRGGRTSPIGLYELATTWPSEEKHMGTSQAVLGVLSIEVQSPRTAPMGSEDLFSRGQW